MSLFKRGTVFYVDFRWRGYPRLKLSTGTTLKTRAKAMERTIYALHNAGRQDLLTLLVEQRLSLEALHEAYEKRGDELEQLVAKAESPEVGGLVTCWRSEEHTSELQSRLHLVCRLLLEKKKKN